MEKKSSNKNLHKASQAKKDEFYTQRVDIEKELQHYKEQFNGKVVYCNCDDPFESNFFKYFAASFKSLKLKQLLSLFCAQFQKTWIKTAYYYELCSLAHYWHFVSVI
jgi:hypothetical protein